MWLFIFLLAYVCRIYATYINMSTFLRCIIPEHKIQQRVRKTTTRMFPGMKTVQTCSIMIVLLILLQIGNWLYYMNLTFLKHIYSKITQIWQSGFFFIFQMNSKRVLEAIQWFWMLYRRRSNNEKKDMSCNGQWLLWHVF